RRASNAPAKRIRYPRIRRAHQDFIGWPCSRSAASANRSKLRASPPSRALMAHAELVRKSALSRLPLGCGHRQGAKARSGQNGQFWKTVSLLRGTESSHRLPPAPSCLPENSADAGGSRRSRLRRSTPLAAGERADAAIRLDLPGAGLHLASGSSVPWCKARLLGGNDAGDRRALSGDR